MKKELRLADFSVEHPNCYRPGFPMFFAPKARTYYRIFGSGSDLLAIDILYVSSSNVIGKKGSKLFDDRQVRERTHLGNNQLVIGFAQCTLTHG
jgi:hypothetical protein